MADIEPIRPDVEPEFDVEREMLDYCAGHLRDYVKTNGKPPMSIAIVLIGPDRAESMTSCNSWSPGDENKSRLHCCAIAAAMLWKRALGL